MENKAIYIVNTKHDGLMGVYETLEGVFNRICKLYHDCEITLSGGDLDGYHLMNASMLEKDLKGHFQTDILINGNTGVFGDKVTIQKTKLLK